MEREIVISLEDFKEMVADQAKLKMLIDGLLNNSELPTLSERLQIDPVVFENIMMTFAPESYKNAAKNAVEWLKAREGRDG